MEKVAETQYPDIEFKTYGGEAELEAIMRLVDRDLSEPYSIYTYRYFVNHWPSLCIRAVSATNPEELIGVIVCKLDDHSTRSGSHQHRGYIAMLAVEHPYRKRGIARELVIRAINTMIEEKADEVTLETEITNGAALSLYDKMGFVREKRLNRYYLNGVDAFRLKLWLH
eukprot:TRINITY_DN5629_c0_g1_i1.p1 TRINITY_DN5629_c0_g1~~TRINITY_DN5629_c0_g1_i1.p1  ORF type:complete len:169 (+),score=31.30 TRINITY_DN5629_c0_g1_i1:3-509(+)